MTLAPGKQLPDTTKKARKCLAHRVFQPQLPATAGPCNTVCPGVACLQNVVVPRGPWPTAFTPAKAHSKLLWLPCCQSHQQATTTIPVSGQASFCRCKKSPKGTPHASCSTCSTVDSHLCQSQHAHCSRGDLYTMQKDSKYSIIQKQHQQSTGQTLQYWQRAV